MTTNKRQSTRRRKDEISFIDGVTGCEVYHPANADGCTCTYEKIPFAAVQFTGGILKKLQKVADIWNKHPHEFDLGSDTFTNHAPSSVLYDIVTRRLLPILEDDIKRRISEYRKWTRRQKRTINARTAR